MALFMSFAAALKFALFAPPMLKMSAPKALKVAFSLELKVFSKLSICASFFTILSVLLPLVRVAFVNSLLAFIKLKPPPPSECAYDESVSARICSSSVDDDVAIICYIADNFSHSAF